MDEISVLTSSISKSSFSINRTPAHTDIDICKNMNRATNRCAVITINKNGAI
jgi:hypothetical protein